MNTFVAKLPPSDCPDHIARPKNVADWASGVFRLRKPKALSGTTARPANLHVGDRVYIWVHEDNGGGGLTALGTVAEINAEGKSFVVRLAGLEIEQPPLSWDKLIKHAADSAALQSLFKYTLTQTLWLDAENAERFSTALAEARSDFQKLKSLYDPIGVGPSGVIDKPSASAEAAALQQHASEIEVEIERRFHLVERRLGQPAFRKKLLEVYSHKCCLTDTDVTATLEAAHIVPFSEGTSFRDDPQNGLLLRADIHTLFDLYLLGIDPETFTVVISKALVGTPYAELLGKKVEVLASAEFLTHHFERIEEPVQLG